MKHRYTVKIFASDDFAKNRERQVAFCDFVNRLAAAKKKFSITPWSGGSEYGFAIWYYE